MKGTHGSDGRGVEEQQWLLYVLAAATFLIFFQAFMIAPLIPRLAQIFHASPTTIGLAVPAYLIPYGLMTLVWGPLSDRVGRRRVILASMAAFVVLTAVTAAVGSASWFIALRAITAVGASGVVPIALALLGDLFVFEERGRALGWLFGAMAGGIGVGSTAGALLEPVIGWRGLFIAVAAAGGAVGVALACRRSELGSVPLGCPLACGWSPGATSSCSGTGVLPEPMPTCSSTPSCTRASTPGSGSPPASLWPGRSRHRLVRPRLRPPRLRLRPGHRPAGRPAGTRPPHSPWPRCRGVERACSDPQAACRGGGR